MKPSHPPRAATWLLKHFTPQRKSEVFLGDLLEQFVERRSATWYWRQVLVTIIVSFAQELRSRWVVLRLAAIRFLFLFVILSIPILLPRFSPYRPAWLMFILVLAIFSTLFSIPLEWLEKRLARVEPPLSRDRMIRGIFGLTASLSASAMLFHFVALRSDSIFFVVLIPSLLAICLAFYSWRMLFGAVADEFHLSRLTCGVAGYTFVALGLVLQHFLSRSHGGTAMLACTIAALGCLAKWPTERASKPQ